MVSCQPLDLTSGLVGELVKINSTEGVRRTKKGLQLFLTLKSFRPLRVCITRTEINIENDMYSRVKSFYQYLSTGLHAVKELIKNALRSRKNSITIDVTYVGDMLE